MKRWMLGLVGFWLGLPAVALAEADTANPGVPEIPEGHYFTLAYHDVRDEVEPEIDADPYAVSTQRLARWFEWMQENDWNPVSLEDIEAAGRGEASLPPNAVLLIFDDGLRSMYTHVFPLLEEFDYPAVSAITTSWQEAARDGREVDYDGGRFSDVGEDFADPDDPRIVAAGGETLYADDFFTWDEAREMHDSGLVEFASHSHDLHHGILANPQGNTQPAAVVREYDPESGAYESEEAFEQRIREDLERSSRVLEERLGEAPRAIVWPYGAGTEAIEEIAAEVGMPYSFTLGSRLFSPAGRRADIGRMLIMDDPLPADILAGITNRLDPPRDYQRAVHVDLDYIHDPDPEQTNRNLGQLLDRIKDMQVRSVYLQAFADPDGDGNADALYFPNRHLPVRDDLFNRVAWQLRTRAGVEVYAWMPLLSFDLPDRERQAGLSVRHWTADGEIERSDRDYRRMSPFLPESAELVGEIYEDLGRMAPGIHGILIHDDAYLGDDEDAAACRPEARWPGSDDPIRDCRLEPRDRTRALIDFGAAMVERAGRHIAVGNDLRVARNMYARPVLDPDAEARFAQALGPFVEHYDEVALMAMPYLDGTDLPEEKWFDRLFEAVDEHPKGVDRVVFELQTRDWEENEWISTRTLVAWIEQLKRRGAGHFAYYPDDPFNDHPELEVIREGMSLTGFPY